MTYRINILFYSTFVENVKSVALIASVSNENDVGLTDSSLVIYWFGHNKTKQKIA